MSGNTPKCFVFAIGGTGSRVLRSLTHLLAAGVKPGNNNFDIVPIIIDPHQDNEDLLRAAALLDSYKSVRRLSDPAGFFPTKLYTLSDMKASEPDKHDAKTVFTFDLKGAGDTFRQYIGHGNMGPENAALADLLFSGRSKKKGGDDCELLDIQMDIGFVGNPNVGSVVLNQIVESEIFSTFANNFNPNNDDRIFIISSIFGGTGAAGFPSLLKNIREGNGVGAANLKKAKVGAVSIMPYFKLEENDSSPINYADFIAKTKSALYYYGKNVTGNKSVNVMYYIGDTPHKNYENDPGHGGQKNNAHFVELAGALSILNFLSIPKDDDRLVCEEKDNDGNTIGRAVNPVCNEFSIQRDAAHPNFFDFKPETQKSIAMPLAQMALFRKYMTEQYKNESHAWRAEPPKLGDDFVTKSFYRDSLEKYFKDFGDWLKELSENNRGFAPFDLKCGPDLKSFIKGIAIEEKGGLAKLFGSKGPAYTDFETYLNAASKNKGDLTPEKKLMDIFHSATYELLDKKYELNNRTGGK